MDRSWFGPGYHEGVIVAQNGDVLVLEFNEFLRRIALGAIDPDAIVVSHALTDGRRRLAGDLNLYALARSGSVETADLIVRSPNGVIASGCKARAAFAQSDDV